MSAPDHNQPFDTFYDQYSVEKRLFEVPVHWDVYRPDGADKTGCVSVIVPSRERGAKVWTYNGRWITLGIYRDSGRAPALRPPETELTWSRTGKTLWIVSPEHKLQTGDVVNLYNVNVPQLLNRVVTKLDDQAFSVESVVFGPETGEHGAFQPTTEWNFYEDSYVFRLLPSFKLVPWSLVQELFEVTTPQAPVARREFYNITTDATVVASAAHTVNTNYDLPVRSLPVVDRLSLERRFDQVYDSDGNPLALKYRVDGEPVAVNNVDSSSKNNPVNYSSPAANESNGGYYDGDDSQNQRIYVYDFYGLDVNDPARGPWHNQNLVTRDPASTSNTGNFLRFEGGDGDPLYAGPLFDEFGNSAVGAQENLALTTIKQVLPLQLDAFNRPTKTPTPRSYDRYTRSSGTLSAPRFLDSTTNAPALALTHTVQLPLTVVKGNLLVLVVTFDTDNPPISSLPSGWQLRVDEINGAARAQVYVKKGAVSDGNKTLTFSFSSVASPTIVVERWAGSFTDSFTAVRTVSVFVDNTATVPTTLESRPTSVSSSWLTIGLEGSAIDQTGLAPAINGAGWDLDAILVNPMRNSALLLAYLEGGAETAPPISVDYGRATTDHLTLQVEIRAN